MTRRLSMAISFFNKGDDPTTKLNRMWLPHLDPLYSVRIENHSSTNLGILNHNQDDTLYVYFWADGVYFTPRMDEDRQCMLVIIGADEWGNKVSGAPITR